MTSKWSVLDTLGDRAAVNLIARLLDGSATLPFGKISDDVCLKMLSARLLKVALACDLDKATTTNVLDLYAPAKRDNAFLKDDVITAATVSAKVPNTLNLAELVGQIGAIPEPPRFVECEYLDGLVDKDGNPAAFLINQAAIDEALPRLTMARTPGKTTEIVLMTPQFAELIAAEAAKHSMKIVIEGRKQ